MLLVHTNTSSPIIVYVKAIITSTNIASNSVCTCMRAFVCFITQTLINVWKDGYQCMDVL